jgi:hypothetical protein
MTRLSLSICVFFAAAAVCAGAASAATTPWSDEQDSDLGFRFSYPRALFARIEGDGKQAFHYFVSPNSDAKLMVGAWKNREGRTPDQFKRWLMANAGGYDELTYRPRGHSWFVLSGYRGDDIYYEKVIAVGRWSTLWLLLTRMVKGTSTIPWSRGWKTRSSRHGPVLKDCSLEAEVSLLAGLLCCPARNGKFSIRNVPGRFFWNIANAEWLGPGWLAKAPVGIAPTAGASCFSRSHQCTGTGMTLAVPFPRRIL